MEISGHRLVGNGVEYESTDKSRAGIEPKYLVMHYTAGGSVQSAVNTLTNPDVKASAHLVIGRQGEIVQLVDFDRIAWHAGTSRWQGLTGLNKYSIGIELDNAGLLTGEPGNWRTWFGRTVPDDEVVLARHQHQDVQRAWHAYTEIQLETAIQVGRLIFNEYKLHEVVGHDDIAPIRKVDPGPAFPMAQFRSHLRGRADEDADRFVTTTRLNVREGPGVQHAKVTDAPLAAGTVLEALAWDASWCAVDVLDNDKQPYLSGWVHGNYIRRI